MLDFDTVLEMEAAANEMFAEGVNTQSRAIDALENDLLEGAEYNCTLQQYDEGEKLISLAARLNAAAAALRRNLRTLFAEEDYYSLLRK